jgi:endonuclease/exonuclease/phosphatase (EEP) superfamily protein YafD
VAVGLVMGALLCVFTPDVFFLKQSTYFTVQIMLCYFLLGMFFFLVNQRNLMLTSLLCCGFLSLYLKSSSNGHLRLAVKTEEPEIRVAMMNLSNAEDYFGTMEAIVEKDADVWTFQEITPDWYHVIDLALCDYYPHAATLLRIDPYGMVVFSKFPIQDIDTFYFQGIPNLVVTIDVQGSSGIHLVSSHTTAPVNSEAYRMIREHFRTVSRYITTLSGPVITCGDYNLPSWATELKEYKALAQLNDSRRDIIPASNQGSLSIFKVPVDHIFFTHDIECTAFRVIQDENARHLGISGTYQLKPVGF